MSNNVSWLQNVPRKFWDPFFGWMSKNTYFFLYFEYRKTSTRNSKLYIFLLLLLGFVLFDLKIYYVPYFCLEYFLQVYLLKEVQDLERIHGVLSPLESWRLSKHSALFQVMTSHSSKMCSWSSSAISQNL